MRSKSVKIRRVEGHLVGKETYTVFPIDKKHPDKYQGVVLARDTKLRADDLVQQYLVEESGLLIAQKGDVVLRKIGQKEKKDE